MSVLQTDIDVRFADFHLHFEHEFRLDGITGLFGQSGAGKTSLLRSIAGLEPGASGKVRLADDVWLDSSNRIAVAAHRRRVGYVFQDVRLFDHLNVIGNLRFALKRARGDAQARPQLDDVIDALALEPMLARRVHVLSGGERQRVGIARALLSGPALMLFDEPLAALDARRKAEIIPYIRALPGRFGIPGIYVSHALDEIAQLADHLVVLSDGRVAAAGELNDVLERLDLGPLVGRFEAGVVLSGVVTEHDPVYALTTLRFGDHSITVPAAELPVGAAVRLRVRARDVSLARQAPQEISIRNIVPGTVREVREEPDTAFAEVLVDIGGVQLRARLTRRSAAELSLAPGTAVYALIKSVALDRPRASGLVEGQN